MTEIPFQPLQPGRQPDELIAVVAIMRAGILGPARLSAALDYLDSAVSLLPQEVGGRGTDVAELLLQSVDRESIVAARQEVERWIKDGTDARTTLDASYPANLQAVFNKPPLLFVQGHWHETRDRRAVAVVGTRSASPDGLKRAARLGRELAKSGVTVISGLAKGIDAMAHEGALRAGGRTIAVMGTGINRRYPAEHAPLAERIVEAGGALLSQFFPEQPPTKWTFPQRNVTMSGLSLATIVVEAGATSGAKMQAQAALNHGRAVFLPTSLVESHPWARNMVEKGFKGGHAVEVASTEAIVDRLDFADSALPLLTA